MTAMWTRGELKDRAKERLRTFYWQGFLVCLIAIFLGAGAPSANVGVKRDVGTGERHFSINGGSGINFSYDNDEGRARIDTPLYHSSLPLRLGFGVMLLTALMIMTVALALGILVSNVLQVGKRRYFLKKAAGVQEAGIGELFSPFREGYGNVVWVMFQQGIYIFLWSLLLVIPGIIKTYEYYMVPYLLAESPHLSWEEARDMSVRMMDGNKFRVFVLELSFIGWDILGALMCGVGHWFVAPYKEAVYAELYRTLKGEAGIRQSLYM